MGGEFDATKSQTTAMPNPSRYPINKIKFRAVRFLRAKAFASSVLVAISGAMYGMNETEPLVNQEKQPIVSHIYHPLPANICHPTEPCTPSSVKEL